MFNKFILALCIFPSLLFAARYDVQVEPGDSVVITSTAAALEVDTLWVVDTLYITDTLVVNDTTFITDTLMVYDTTFVVDTVFVIDTVTVVDTVYVQTGGSGESQNFGIVVRMVGDVQDSLQSAVTNIGNLGGGIVYLVGTKADTVELTDTITISKGNWKLVGIGPVFIRVNNGGYAFQETEGSDGWVIDGINFIGTSGAHGVIRAINGSNGIGFVNNSVAGFTNANSTIFDVDSSAMSWLVERNLFENNSIVKFKGRHSGFRFNTFKNMPNGLCFRSQYNRVYDNDFYSVHGKVIEASAFGYETWFAQHYYDIQRNNIYSVDTLAVYGIYAAGGGGIIDGNRIVPTQATYWMGCKNGIYATGGQEQLRITNNTVLYSTNVCIYSSAISITNVSGNYIYGYHNAIVTGIETHGNWSSITNNNVHRCATGILAYGTYVGVDGNTHYNVVTHENVSGVTYPAMGASLDLGQ